MNKVIFLGRLTRDPAIRQSANSTVAQFTIAVDRRFRRDNDPEADFFDCAAFGRLAEFVGKYLHKGSKIVLSGSLRNNKYTNREGQTVYAVQVVAEEIDFAESKRESERPAAGQQEPPTEDSYGFMNLPDGIDEELPFN